MNATGRREVIEISGLDTKTEVREALIADTLRIDRPQRGSLRLIRSRRSSLYVIHLQRP